MKWCLLCLGLLLLAGCEKAINFKLKETEPKLVVEATIENDQYPIIILTKSIGYFSTISLDQLQNSFVHQADVYVSNGTKTHKLKEYSVHLGALYYMYYYSVDSANLSSAFKGEINHNYSLRIIADSREYNANTTIPNITHRIDSLFWKPAPPGNDSNEVQVMVRATDRPGFGDYIRYFTKRNSEPFYAGINSVYDDQVIDGTTYTLQVERGWDRNVEPANRTSFFLKGDTVTLKVCNIDKATYNFWRTMEYSYASIGNPFSTPTKILSNISNNALGYFGGYAAQYRTIIIPR
ncbi:MAG: DUF4249 domain-containing protein [Chitinophagaceae bacterium]